MSTVPTVVKPAVAATPTGAKRGVLASVKDILGQKRKFRLALIGEPGAGKTSTSSTLTPGKGTCVICTLPDSQMITHHPDSRIYVPTNFDDAIAALKAPEAIFGNDIETLVLDDSTTLISRGLEEKGVTRANDPRQTYKGVQFAVEPALLAAISKGFHFVLIAQARKMANDINGLQEITLDVPPSMENTAVAYVDYIFFVNKALELGKPPMLQLVRGTGTPVLTKVKFSRDQFGKIPVKDTEPADLAALWLKLRGEGAK